MNRNTETLKVREVLCCWNTRSKRLNGNLEKDHLLNQKSDLEENITKLDKKREALLRENEKLKNETKISRRSTALGGGFYNSNLLLQKSTNTASKDETS